MRLIDEQYLHTPFYGSRGLTQWLIRRGYDVNRKRVHRLMRVMGLEAIYPRRRTSVPAPEHRIYPYLLRNVAIASIVAFHGAGLHSIARVLSTRRPRSHMPELWFGVVAFSCICCELRTIDMRCFTFVFFGCVMEFFVASVSAAEPKYSFIDLQPVANVGTLGGFPRVEQKLGEAPFKVGPREIALGSKLRPERPGSVEIPVNLKFTKLFILHATSNGGYPAPHATHSEDGVFIGQYMVRYSDGSGEGIPIVYGEDVRDGWNWDKGKETKRGKVVWTGENASAKMNGVDVRLYGSSWTNPKPDLEIKSIVYSSQMDQPCAPYCIALTARE
jgi:hypothetical protein